MVSTRQRKRLFIFINGIMNNPGDAKNWTDRAVSWTHKKTTSRAEKFEYFTGVLTRRLFQSGHARDLADIIAGYAFDNWEIHLVGHSNGCDLILRALKLLPYLEIKELHLISGACDPDFEKNGLNWRMEDGRLGHVTVYVAGADVPMKIAEWTGKVLGWIGLGYGTLGRRGPVNAIADGNVTVITRAAFGHSTWFTDEHFEELMRLIHGMETNPSALCRKK